jgi:hypothetical protein
MSDTVAEQREVLKEEVAVETEHWRTDTGISI